MKKCYIVILNYKKWDDTLACLESVFNSVYDLFSVVVIDNNSCNRSLENIIEGIRKTSLKKCGTNMPVSYKLVDRLSLPTIDISSFPDIVFIQNEKNIGFSAGNNIALRMLLKEDAYVWLLNPDMVIEPTTLGELVNEALIYPTAIIGAVTKNFNNKSELLFYGGGKINYWSATISFIKKIDHIHRIRYISGGAMFIQTNHLTTLGLLPENYFLYWEDADWNYNALKKGFPLRVCLNAVCYDKISTSIGRGFLSDYYYTRNGLSFLLKYKKWYLPSAISLILFRIAKRLIFGQISRAKGSAKGVMDFLTKERYENQ